MTALTISALVARAARTHGAREVIELRPDGVRAVHTLGDIARSALALGHGLRARGLAQGTVVASILGNGRPHLEALWGVPAVGLVLHPLNPRATREALVHALRRSGDACVLADPPNAGLARRIAEEAGIPCVVVTAESWSHDASADEVTDESLPALMCEAAGTVGLPRAVVYSHRAIVLHAMACATVDGLGIGRRDVVFPAMPLHAANGCGLPYTLALVGHGMVLAEPSLDAAALRAVMSAEGVSFAASVSSTWVALAEHLAASPDGPALRPGLRLLAGGNAAPQALVDDLGARGVEVLHVYGMTETGPLATAAPGESAQGAVVPLMELRVVDERGDELPWDGSTEGEVILRGPWVATSYVALGATPDRWTVDGWLRTGDLGVRDARGSLRVTGRRKPLVRCGGRWIDADLLARLAATHPAVASARAQAIPHPRLIEQPELALTLRAGVVFGAEDLFAHLAAAWADGELPPVSFSVRGEGLAGRSDQLDVSTCPRHA